MIIALELNIYSNVFMYFQTPCVWL